MEVWVQISRVCSDGVDRCVGRIFDARQVFDEMTERDVFAWTSMVSVHARAGDLVSAKKLFEEMPERNFAS
ncbi:putative tetratricopeptide-like helical domain superfamily [Helianthus debilis subsp. tardiflorus]